MLYVENQSIIVCFLTCAIICTYLNLNLLFFKTLLKLMIVPYLKVFSSLLF